MLEPKCFVFFKNPEKTSGQMLQVFCHVFQCFRILIVTFVVLIFIVLIFHNNLKDYYAAKYLLP